MNEELKKAAEEYASIIDIPAYNNVLKHTFINAIKSTYNQRQILQAQIDVLEELEKRGALNVYQATNTPNKLYVDIINPLLKELQAKLNNLK